jgi:hypothetical protein
MPNIDQIVTLRYAPYMKAILFQQNFNRSVSFMSSGALLSAFVSSITTR